MNYGIYTYRVASEEEVPPGAMRLVDLLDDIKKKTLEIQESGEVVLVDGLVMNHEGSEDE